MTPSAERLWVEICGQRAKRVPLERLERALVMVEPAMATDPGRRQRLLELLWELEAGLKLALPRQFRERSQRPALPLYATLLREPAAVARGRLGARYPWRPELSWAAQAQLDAETLHLCQRVNDFLRDGGAERELVHIRERSLELLGDDKKLEQMLGRRIFGPGRLSLGLLRCRKAPPPFYWRRLGDGPDLLVVENHPTFWTLTQVLAEGGEVGMIGFGSGAEFEASVTYARELGPRRILYFGDIDGKGLAIPQAASQHAQREGLPAVEPAADLYALLLKDPILQPALALPRVRAERLVRWLPADLQQAALSHLVEGRRVVQENITAERYRSANGSRTRTEVLLEA